LRFLFADIDASCDLVVFACIANFLSDSVDSAAHDQVQGISETIARHLSIIHEFASSHPCLPVAVVSPLCRMNPSWFFIQYVIMQDVFRDLFEQCRKKTPNLHLFSSPDRTGLKFNTDGVHLNPGSGSQYVYDLFDQCWKLFEKVPDTSKLPPVVHTDDAGDLSDDESFKSMDHSPLDITVVAAEPAETVTMAMLLSEIRKTNVVDVVKDQGVRLTGLEKKVTSELKSTDLAIARIYEDQDFASNVLKENRVTIGSLKITESPPIDRASWIKLLTSKVQYIVITLFKPNDPALPKVLGVAVRSMKLNYKKEFPNFEAIFESSSQALAFRRVVGLASKQKTCVFYGLFISNSVSISTRVRIEVLMALSRRLNELGFQSHVQSYISRPVIHVKSKSAPVSKVYTFTDSVTQFEPYFSSLDLSGAYRRAGKFFEGTLSRYFVVLNDSHVVANKPATQFRPKRSLESANFTPTKKSR